MKSRKEIPEKDKWQLAGLYPSFEAWEKNFNEPTSLEKLLNLRGRVKDHLKEALELSFELFRRAEKLYTWAHLKFDEDMTSTEAKTAYEKAFNHIQELAQATSWLEPEILLLDESVKETVPDYRFHLEKLFHLKDHRLSAREEELMALASLPLATAHKSFSSLNDADFKFHAVKDSKKKKHEVSHARYSLLMQSKDRTLRENCFNSFHHHYAHYKNTLCNLLQGQVQTHIFDVRARRFSSALEAALKPKNIPLSVYRSLIDTVKKRLGSLTPYFKFRKECLGVDELHLFDMNVSLAKEPDLKISYKEAEKLVIESVKPLGEEYTDVLRKGLHHTGWVDRFENEGKRSGAYSGGCFDSEPYILMNYKNILRDVFTLAHEAGHSMHSYFSRKNQPYHYSDYPIFVAEIASTFNEQMLFELLLEKFPEHQATLLQSHVDNIRATLFRQTMFAEFELKIHELVESGHPLTPELLEENYYNLVKSYFPAPTVIDDAIAIEWARIPHFYYNFYVYQYATGISAAIALSQKVMKGGDAERQSYLRFLKSGSSKYPIDLLKEAGVAMDSGEPFDAAIDYFDSLVNRLRSVQK